MERQLRQTWRLALIAALVGLLMACYSRVANADETRGLPPGTTVTLPRGGETFVTTETMFMVTRKGIDNANTSAEMERRLTKSLINCTRVLKPEPGWRVASRWAFIGALIGGAFTAGLLLK